MTKQTEKLEPCTNPAVPMILYCPNCGLQHIDKDNSEDLRLLAAETGRDREGDKELDRWLEDNEWTNPPHRSHLCSCCGTIWRPADICTVGVDHLHTAGKSDTWPKHRVAAPAKEDEIPASAEPIPPMAPADVLIAGRCLAVLARKVSNSYRRYLPEETGDAIDEAVTNWDLATKV